MANSVRRAKEIVLGCLNRLYRDDSVLFLEKGLCERCLVFRFAHEVVPPTVELVKW